MKYMQKPCEKMCQVNFPLTETDGHRRTEWFLLEGEEARVNELEVLHIIIDHIIKFESLSPQSVLQVMECAWQGRTGVQAALSQMAYRNPCWNTIGATSSSMSSSSIALPKERMRLWTRSQGSRR